MTIKWVLKTGIKTSLIDLSPFDFLSKLIKILANDIFIAHSNPYGECDASGSCNLLRYNVSSCPEPSPAIEIQGCSVSAKSGQIGLVAKTWFGIFGSLFDYIHQIPDIKGVEKALTCSTD